MRVVAKDIFVSHGQLAGALIHYLHLPKPGLEGRLQMDKQPVLQPRPFPPACMTLVFSATL